MALPAEPCFDGLPVAVVAVFSTGLGAISLFSALCCKAGETAMTECAQLRKTYGS